mgnify:CR=1 FL=1
MTPINRLLIGVILFNLLTAVGCHRGYYRRQADAEARRLILEKAVDPRWDSATGSIEINPASRMFDPFSADHPPIPPDDATSHQLMHYVDGKEGYPRWNANGDTNYVANPEWQKYLSMNDEGQLVLSLDAAFQLALLHSTEYQRARETLYLSALDVSLDRFGFDSQLLWGFDTFEKLTRGNTSLDRSGDLSLNKLGITGTNFAVGLANTILFNFGGSDSQAASTLLDFSIIQPLLRGAGRERVMEALTQSERTLLANVRQFDRFRRSFYLQIAIGRGLSATLNRAGDYLGIPGTAGLGANGYIGLLEQQQNIRNQEFNVLQLESVLELFRELFLREQIDAQQLKQFESRVYGQQRSLLTRKTGYQTTLDRFKITLGLPPTLDILIDDSYLEQFEFISDEINKRLITTNKIREIAGEELNILDRLFDGYDATDPDNEDSQWPADLAERVQQLVPRLDVAEEEIKAMFDEDIKQIEADFMKLELSTSRRGDYLKNLRESISLGKISSPVDMAILETDSIPQVDELRTALNDLNLRESILNRVNNVKSAIAQIKKKAQNFGTLEKTLSKKEAFDYLSREFQDKIPGELSELNQIALEMSLLQARTRSNSIEIIDISIEADEAIEIARCMRRDWMNARASHVDNWRNIDFVANRLEAQVDLVFDGDIKTRSDASNPFKLRYDTGNLRAGFRFDAPIVRLSERNSYRSALIGYQQSRRRFYKFEDSIEQNLRDIDRNIKQNKVLFELDRRTVQVDIENVEINRFKLDQPGRAGLSNTVARDIADAIIRLNQSQNSLLNSWVRYEVLRRNLDFDMGTMLLDENGRWIDPGPIDSMIGQRSAEALGIELDCQFCEGVAAPGFVAPPLSSNGLPSVIAPPTQNDSSNLAPRGNGDSNPPRTQSDLPKVGANLSNPTPSMQPQPPAETSIQLTSKTVSQLLASMKKNRVPSSQLGLQQEANELVSPRQSVPPNPRVNEYDFSPKPLDPVNLLKTGIKVEPLNQSDPISPSTRPSKPESSLNLLMQTSRLLPIQISPLQVSPLQMRLPSSLAKEETTDSNVVVRAYHNPVDEFGRRAHQVDLKMIAVHNPSPVAATVKDATFVEEPHWQSQSSSLGGLLNRFNVESNN